MTRIRGSILSKKGGGVGERDILVFPVLNMILFLNLQLSQTHSVGRIRENSRHDFLSHCLLLFFFFFFFFLGGGEGTGFSFFPLTVFPSIESVTTFSAPPLPFPGSAYENVMYVVGRK